MTAATMMLSDAHHDPVESEPRNADEPNKETVNGEQASTRTLPHLPDEIWVKIIKEALQSPDGVELSDDGSIEFLEDQPHHVLHGHATGTGLLVGQLLCVNKMFYTEGRAALYSQKLIFDDGGDFGTDALWHFTQLIRRKTVNLITKIQLPVSFCKRVRSSFVYECVPRVRSLTLQASKEVDMCLFALDNYFSDLIFPKLSGIVIEVPKDAVDILGANYSLQSIQRYVRNEFGLESGEGSFLNVVEMNHIGPAAISTPPRKVFKFTWRTAHDVQY